MLEALQLTYSGTAILVGLIEDVHIAIGAHETFEYQEPYFNWYAVDSRVNISISHGCCNAALQSVRHGRCFHRVVFGIYYMV